jgi:two-component system, OmpR family, response regulator ResD
MSKTHSVLIVDDEATIREVVRRYLELDGFVVTEAESGSQALEILQDHKVDLIILDIMLPGLDGFSVTRSLRNSPDYAGINTHGDIPIIILTSRSDEADRIVGFELGVDDYIVKPFSPRELVHRVKAVLRRTAPNATSSEKPLDFPHLQIDPLRRTVIALGKSAILTAKEFDLLWLFARHPQQVFTREQILAQVWGYEFYGDESTVTVHIRRLREKIEVDPANPVYIQTVWGIGYKFEPS